MSGKCWNGGCNNITLRCIEDNEKPCLILSIAHDLSLYSCSASFTAPGLSTRRNDCRNKLNRPLMRLRSAAD
jgi:hypothetical protein